MLATADKLTRRARHSTINSSYFNFDRNTSFIPIVSVLNLSLRNVASALRTKATGQWPDPGFIEVSILNVHYLTNSNRER
jgi:hypothetical protein